MKKLFIQTLIALSIFFVSPLFVLAEVNATSGFVSGQIWYSKGELIEGETVNIYTAVWNGEKNPISVKVEFYDKNVVLGSRNITLKSSQLRDVSIPWKMTAGDHIISAKITSSSQTVSGKNENISLERDTTSNDKQFVSVLVKDSNGKPVSTVDIVQDKLKNTGSNIVEVIPDSVTTTISSSFDAVENFRSDKSEQFGEAKDNTRKELGLTTFSDDGQTISKNINMDDVVKNPLGYIKLFFVTLLATIFANKTAFYVIGAVLILLILRSIYRRIRNR